MKAKYHLPLLAILATQMAYADTNPQNKTQKPWQGSAELGMILTTGNSQTTNINSKLNIVQQLKKWRNTYTFSSIYADSDDTKTEEQYRGTVQGDYIFNDHQFWYVRGAYDKNLFSGYEYQSSTSTGYGNRFWQEDDGSYLEASVGLGYRNNIIDENNTTDDSERTPITRFSATYEKNLSKTSLFRQELNTEIGTEHGSSITESVSSLQANIVDNLAMKVSYRIKYSSEVPADTENTDTETTVSMLYSF
ncbi:MULTISPECIES: DUF481 domain-containing protein [Marinomonas]|uniref:DUF481 domain-containing protein n=1 Tax=Marinomonas TaxID=28253 RepID=UPI001054882B|nr:DUF481 domain-containing protein [Marinomonas flavescens]